MKNYSETRIYLNNAATSWPKAPGVSEAVKRALEEQPGAANRGGIDSFDVFNAVRERLGSLLGVGNKNRIALGPNATWGLNLGIFGFPLKKGDRVLTTCAEHNSVLRPLFRLGQQGIEVHYLDVDAFGRVLLESWKDALNRYRPALCVFSHASNVTGALNDAETLISAAKETGAAVLVDASQSLGCAPVEAGRWGADMVAFTGHKYLLGPQGTGGLYVAPGLELTPWLVGGTGIHSDLDTMPSDMPLHLEAGTGNEPSFHGLLAALEWAADNPMDVNAQREKLEYLKSGMTAAGARIIDPRGECTPVLSFVVDGYTPADTADILASSYDIVCRTGLHCAPKIFRCLGFPEGTVRVSMSRFTAYEEIDALVRGVADIKDSL